MTSWLRTRAMSVLLSSGLLFLGITSTPAEEPDDTDFDPPKFDRMEVVHAAPGLPEGSMGKQQPFCKSA